MIYFMVWLGCAMVASIIGSKKGEAGLAFLIGLVLGPFGILFALMSTGNRKECQFCKEMMHKDATICPRCQKEVKNYCASLEKK